MGSEVTGECPLAKASVIYRRWRKTVTRKRRTGQVLKNFYQRKFNHSNRNADQSGRVVQSDLNKVEKNADVIRANIRECAHNILNYLNLNGRGSDDLRYSLKNLRHLRSKVDQLALTLVNEELERTTHDLTAAQKTIVSLIEKNRKINSENVELRRQIARSERSEIVENFQANDLREYESRTSESHTLNQVPSQKSAGGEHQETAKIISEDEIIISIEECKKMMRSCRSLHQVWLAEYRKCSGGLRGEPALFTDNSASLERRVERFVEEMCGYLGTIGTTENIFEITCDQPTAEESMADENVPTKMLSGTNKDDGILELPYRGREAVEGSSDDVETSSVRALNELKSGGNSCSRTEDDEWTKGSCEKTGTVQALLKWKQRRLKRPFDEKDYVPRVRSAETKRELEEAWDACRRYQRHIRLMDTDYKEQVARLENQLEHYNCAKQEAEKNLERKEKERLELVATKCSLQREVDSITQRMNDFEKLYQTCQETKSCLVKRADSEGHTTVRVDVETQTDEDAIPPNIEYFKRKWHEGRGKLLVKRKSSLKKLRLQRLYRKLVSARQTNEVTKAKLEDLIRVISQVKIGVDQLIAHPNGTSVSETIKEAVNKLQPDLFYDKFSDDNTEMKLLLREVHCDVESVKGIVHHLNNLCDTNCLDQRRNQLVYSGSKLEDLSSNILEIKGKLEEILQRSSKDNFKNLNLKFERIDNTLDELQSEQIGVKLVDLSGAVLEMKEAVATLRLEKTNCVSEYTCGASLEVKEENLQIGRTNNCSEEFESYILEMKETFHLFTDKLDNNNIKLEVILKNFVGIESVLQNVVKNFDLESVYEMFKGTVCNTFGVRFSSEFEELKGAVVGIKEAVNTLGMDRPGSHLFRILLEIKEAVDKLQINCKPIPVGSSTECQEMTRKLQETIRRLKEHKRNRNKLMVCKQIKIDEKEKSILSLQERIQRTRSTLQESREKLLKQKSCEHSLHRLIISLQCEKRDMVFRMKELEYQVLIERGLRKKLEAKYRDDCLLARQRPNIRHIVQTIIKEEGELQIDQV